MSTLQQAIAAIQNIAAALSGMRAAPAYAPDSINQFPFAVSYPAHGSVGGTDFHQARYTIVTEIHVSRRDLPRDMATLMPYVELFTQAVLASPTLGLSATALAGTIEFDFAVMEWAGVPTIGFVFKTPVKQVAS